MQRDTLIQQLWLDYVHHQPDIGGLRLWPSAAKPEYLTLLTLSQGPCSIQALMPLLTQHGYQPRQRYAMPERGLLITLLATETPDDTWLVLAELQLATLARRPRDRLLRIVESADTNPLPLPVGRRLWSMPSWEDYCLLMKADPLAAWLAVMGARIHHPGFDCGKLGEDIELLDQHLYQTGFSGDADRQHGVFPVSPLLDYRYYPTHAQRVAFADGDSHRLSLGGLSLVQKRVIANQDRSVELLLPHHTLCEHG